MNKEKILKTLDMIIDDCAKDVVDFAGRGFNGITLGGLHGIIEAKIKELAEIITKAQRDKLKGER
ncbi:MAG: hypothetical protein KKB31_06370 [Nanoarchaeota archaeon]|nr:hypothetical protein [Nanoarchaeota archaeon]